MTTLEKIGDGSDPIEVANEQEKPGFATLKPGEKQHIPLLKHNQVLCLEYSGMMDTRKITIFRNATNNGEVESYSFIWNKEFYVIPIVASSDLVDINSFLSTCGIELQENGDLAIGGNENDQHSPQDNIFYAMKPADTPTGMSDTMVMPAAPGIDVPMVSGEMANGSTYYGFSVAECGQGRDDMNEDCFGINEENIMIVVVDGMGGYACGQIIAHEATKTSLQNSKEDLKTSLPIAKDRMKTIFRFFPKAKVKLPNAVFTAVKIENNKLDTATTGDAPWFLVRKREIVARNIPRTEAFDEFFKNNTEITEAQILDCMANPKNHKVTTSLYSKHEFNVHLEPVPGKPGYWRPVKNVQLELQDGDDVWITSDGGQVVSHQQIIEYSQMPQGEGIKKMKEDIATINKEGSVDIKIQGLKTPKTLEAPRDNETAVLYRHKMPTATIRIETGKAANLVTANSPIQLAA